MPSPITAADFDLQSFSEDVCERLRKLLELNNTLKTWFEWAFDANGNVSTSFLAQFNTAFFPIGGIVFFPVSDPPDGYLICNGAQYARADYANLFAVIGTTHNQSGDTDATLFRVPDLQNKYLAGASPSQGVGDAVGANSVVLTSNSIPAHQHLVPVYTTENGLQRIGVEFGATAKGSTEKLCDDSNNALPQFYPHTSSVGGSQAHENRPLSLVGLWLIKT